MRCTLHHSLYDMVDTDKDGEASLEEVLLMLTNYFSNPKERAPLTCSM